MRFPPISTPTIRTPNPSRASSIRTISLASTVLVVVDGRTIVVRGTVINGVGRASPVNGSDERIDVSVGIELPVVATSGSPPARPRIQPSNSAAAPAANPVTINRRRSSRSVLFGRCSSPESPWVGSTGSARVAAALRPVAGACEVSSISIRCGSGRVSTTHHLTTSRPRRHSGRITPGYG